MAKDMTKGSPWRLLLGFSIPLLIGNIFQQLYNLADAVIVGKTLRLRPWARPAPSCSSSSASTSA